MRTDYIIDKLTGVKMYGICRDSQKIEISIDFSDDKADFSISPNIAGSTFTLEGKFTELTMREIVGQTDDFDNESSEELDIFLEQFTKE